MFLTIVDLYVAKIRYLMHFFLRKTKDTNHNNDYTLVPEMLALMVDLEDDPEWSVSDELEDEDGERYKTTYCKV